MKTKEELNALKEEVETVSKELRTLTDEELKQVAGGDVPPELATKHDYKLSDDPAGKWLCE